MQKSVTRNSTIDVVRLIAAFFVVYIHVGIFDLPGKTGEVGTAFLAVARLAVPFFFIVSGYFLYSKNYTDQSQRALKSIKKIALLFLSSTILYFFFYGWYFGSYNYTFHLMTPKTFFDMIVFNKPFYNEALWFLLALIGATALHWLNAKYIKRDNLLLVMAVIFYIAGLIFGGNYGSATGTGGWEVMITRNFLGYALLFTVLGYMIHKYQNKIRQLSWPRYLRYSVIAIFLYVIEYYVIAQNVAVPKDIYFLTPVVTALILIGCIKAPSFLSTTRIPEAGSKLAIYVYILHIGILYALTARLPRIGLDPHTPYVAVARIFVTFLLALLIGGLYLYAKNRLIPLIKRVPLFRQF